MVFHVFTLAIPLIIVLCYRCCHPPLSPHNRVVSKGPLSNEGRAVANPLLPPLPEGVEREPLPQLTEVQRQALYEVEDLLEHASDLILFSFVLPDRSPFLGPFSDTKIPAIAALYKTYLDQFVQKLLVRDFYLENGGCPWALPENSEIADKLIKLAFALCYYAIADYPRYRAGRQRQHGLQVPGMGAGSLNWDRSLGDALGEPTYLFPSIQRVRTIYSYLRGAFSSGDGRWYANSEIADSEIYSARFYTLGTPECNWREFYNDYCVFVTEAIENSPQGKSGSVGREGLKELIQDQPQGVWESEDNKKDFDYRMQTSGGSEYIKREYFLGLCVGLTNR